MHECFPTGLTESEKLLLLDIYDAVAGAMAPGTWMLYSGAQIGQALFEDMLPWDDDIDILAYEIPPLDVFGEFDAVVNRYGPKGEWPMMKVFHKERGAIIRPDLPYTFPFIDIAVMKQDRLMLEHPSADWKLDRFPVDEVFPLRKVPFCGRETYVGNRSTDMLARKFGPEWATVAVPPSWSHRTEAYTGYPRMRVPLTEILA